MFRKFFLTLILVMGFLAIKAQDQATYDRNPEGGRLPEEVMSEAYWKLWNPEVQSRIDRDIEKYRKADALLEFKGLAAGTTIEVEQISHDFIFGANIFNFNQLGTFEQNRRYKELFGTLFNSATIAFYWKAFEMQPNRPRFKEEYWDTEKYWNQVKEPKGEPHWRRPATDPVVEFCENKEIRLHGHTLIWGNRQWQHPDWMYEEFCPDNEKKRLSQLTKEELEKMMPQEIASLAPAYFKEMDRLFRKRIVEIAEYYGDRLDSWDVVNESSVDFHGESLTGTAVCKSSYGLMPGDYFYKAFKTADTVFPQKVLLNINDYTNDENYVEQVNNLRDHKCRIDIMGSQMHLFNPQQCLDIAEGKQTESPEIVWKKMETISKAGLPIHLSEITITSPGNDERGQFIQAVIARNLYRLWFGIEKMMGITWWNVVDECGAPGETTISGLFFRNMKPKPAFFALDKLINDEWKTRATIIVGEDGTARFRGFKGRYRVTWNDSAGEEQIAEFHLKNNGDGF